MFDGGLTIWAARCVISTEAKGRLEKSRHELNTCMVPGQIFRLRFALLRVTMGVDSRTHGDGGFVGRASPHDSDRRAGTLALRGGHGQNGEVSWRPKVCMVLSQILRLRSEPALSAVEGMTLGWDARMCVVGGSLKSAGLGDGGGKVFAW